MAPNTPDSDLYPSFMWRDPMLMASYIRTNDVTSTREQVRADWLLKSYITKIDEEIADDIEEFREHRDLIVEILDAARTYGFCAVQFYADDKYKVFTPCEYTDWIKEPNADGINEMVGMKVRWIDEMQNNREDDLYFDLRENAEGLPEQGAYFISWKKGNGVPLASMPWLTAVAVPDLTLDVHSLAITCRQIAATLGFSATNPYFYHFLYGESITQKQRTAIITQMSYVNATNGIGAKESVLKEIRAVENGSTEKCIVGLDQLLAFFSAATRLPLSYYLGEKQIGSGLDSGGAENVDEQKVMKKKQLILQHFIMPLQQIFKDQFGETLSDDLAQFYTQQQEQQKQEEKDMQNRQMSVRESNAGLAK